MSMDVVGAIIALRRTLACAANATFTGSMTIRHAAVLRELRESGPLPQVALARAIAVDPSLLMRLLDDLSELALVEKKRSSADRRVVVASITPLGRKALRPLDAARKRLVKAAERVLDAQERAQFVALATRINAAFSEFASSAEPPS